jgi:flagellar basal-body rod modification protein FlgD
MDFTATLSAQELQRVQQQVNSFNKALGGNRGTKESLGKNDFLKLLITQLSHQDPTKPMKDKEFIAQMAQFSTLEQMTNMSEEFSKLRSLVSSSQAYNLLGKSVEIVDGDTTVQGTVEEVVGQEFPQVLVNGKYYDYQHVEKVKR